MLWPSCCFTAAVTSSSRTYEYLKINLAMLTSKGASIRGACLPRAVSGVGTLRSALSRLKYGFCLKCLLGPYPLTSPALLCPQKIFYLAEYMEKITPGSTSTTVFLLYDTRFVNFHRSSRTFNQRVHHPAMDSSVLSLRCGKAAAVFVPCKDRDSVAEV